MTNKDWSGTTSFALVSVGGDRFVNETTWKATSFSFFSKLVSWLRSLVPRIQEVEAPGGRISTVYYPGIRLVVTQDHVDVVNSYPRGNFMGDNKKRVRGGGEAYLFDWRADIDTTKLTTTSYRLENLLTNAWQFELVFIWSEADSDGAITPLAMRDVVTGLSADPLEGDASAPIPPIGLLASNDTFDRILAVISTSSLSAAGIPNPSDISLRIEGNGQAVALDFPIPETPQSDLKRGWTNVYEFKLDASLRKRDIQRVLLRTQSDNLWASERVTIFGLTATGAIPIVNDTSLQRLSSDPSDAAGSASREVSLTLL
jgi:hypothetical protein